MGARRTSAAAPTLDVERLVRETGKAAGDAAAIANDAARGAQEEIRRLHEELRRSQQATTAAMLAQKTAYDLLEAERLEAARLRGELERERCRDKAAAAEIMKLQMIDSYVKAYAPEVIIGAREIVHALKGDGTGRVREALGAWIVALPDDVRRAAYAAAPKEYRALAEAMGSQGRGKEAEGARE